MHFAFLFPRFKMLSGAERLILKLAGALLERGEQITILCHQFDPSCRPILPPAAQLIVTGIRLDRFRNRYANAAFDYFRSFALLDRMPAGIDAACCFGPALTASKAIRERFKIPVLYFCYEPPRFLYTDKKEIQKRLGFFRIVAGPAFQYYRSRDLNLVSRVDEVLSNSEFGKKQILETYERDATVITHGLDPYVQGTRRAQIRETIGFAPTDIAVITVNYLHPRKRIGLFLKAAQLARKTNPTFRALVVGAGPERAVLQDAAEGVAVFTGFVPESEMHEYYQAADLYLHTAKLETFGLSVIEAAGNKLPVVSVNEGGPIETVRDGETGLLVPDDAASLSEAILKLADSELRARFGAAGYAYVRGKYDWRIGADDFLSAASKARKHQG